MNLLTTKEVAERLGVTQQRVQAMIKDGRLPAQKMGRDWFVNEEDLKLVEDRKPGRPPKQGTQASTTNRPPAKKARKKSKGRRLPK
jgi:excisionase family DNA binding protein